MERVSQLLRTSYSIRNLESEVWLKISAAEGNAKKRPVESTGSPVEVKRTPLFARAPVCMLEFFLQRCYPVHPLVEEEGKGDHSTDPLHWQFVGGGEQKVHRRKSSGMC